MFAMSVNEVPGWSVLIVPRLIGVPDAATPGFGPHDEVLLEALPELLDVKREAFARLAGRVSDDAVIASASSTISPRHLADAVARPERFLVATGSIRLTSSRWWRSWPARPPSRRWSTAR
jgi:hypothetical protein